MGAFPRMRSSWPALAVAGKAALLFEVPRAAHVTEGLAQSVLHFVSALAEC